MVSVKCSDCKAVNRFDDELAGSFVTCNECGAQILVPSAASTPGQRPDRPAKSEEEDTPAPKSKARKRKRQDADEDEGSAARPKKRRPSRDADDEDDPDADDDRPRKRKKESSSGPLGPVKAIYGSHGGTLRMVTVISGALVSIALLMCILSQATKIVPESVAIPFAAIFIPAGMFGLYWCLSFLSLKVSVHAGGLTFAHRVSEREIPWENIQYVWQEITEAHQSGGPAYLYTIELDDRSQFKFSSSRIHDVEKLGNLIMERTCEFILPQVRAEYDEGRLVGFGKLGVSQRGLHYGKHVLPWQDVQGVKVVDGKVSVNKRGKWSDWCSIPASSIPNLHVFLTFVNAMVRT